MYNRGIEKVNNIPPQECYFYEGVWNEDNVGVFISVLAEWKKKGVWVVNAENKDAVENARDYVNIIMEETFTWDDVLAQMNTLKKCYNTFKTILETEGVEWVREWNHVYAPSWDCIFKANDFSKAFYHKGDEQYDKLKLMFGVNNNILDDYIISSDEAVGYSVNSATAPCIIQDSGDKQEVNSPNMIGRKPPRKKLFADADCNPCRAIISAGRFNSNMASPKEPSKVPAKVIKNQSSSCASSSPYKLGYNPNGKK